MLVISSFYLIQSHFRDFNKVWRTTKAVLAPKAMLSKWSGKPRQSEEASCHSPFFAGRNIVPSNCPSEEIQEPLRQCFVPNSTLHQLLHVLYNRR